MIKLSTKGRYGTRLMVNLARHAQEGKDAVILKAISEEEGISIRYLEQIIIPLKINKLARIQAPAAVIPGHKAEEIDLRYPSGPRGHLLPGRVRRGRAVGQKTAEPTRSEGGLSSS
jgi:hypothetical protein